MLSNFRMNACLLVYIGAGKSAYYGALAYGSLCVAFFLVRAVFVYFSLKSTHKNVFRSAASNRL